MRGRTERCPQCGSNDVVQVAFHEPDGYNGFICDHCGARWGN